MTNTPTEKPPNNNRWSRPPILTALLKLQQLNYEQRKKELEQKLDTTTKLLEKQLTDLKDTSNG